MTKLFYTTHFILPLVLLPAGILIEYSGLDLLLIQPFFDASTGKWPYKSHWLASDILHTGGKNFVAAIAAGIFLVFALSFFVERLKPFRKDSAYLLAASLAGPALVSICKHMTHIYTPWDLTIFGGMHPYIRLFDAVPEGAKIGMAFPAGHSSGGFAFFSLYFLGLAYNSNSKSEMISRRRRLRRRRRTVSTLRSRRRASEDSAMIWDWNKPSLRYAGLCFALVLGFTFGIAQQVRGAHFLSHDLFSLVICWYAALAVYQIFFKLFPAVPSRLSDRTS